MLDFLSDFVLIFIMRIFYKNNQMRITDMQPICCFKSHLIERGWYNVVTIPWRTIPSFCIHFTFFVFGLFTCTLYNLFTTNDRIWSDVHFFCVLHQNQVLIVHLTSLLKDRWSVKYIKGEDFTYYVAYLGAKVLIK